MMDERYVEVTIFSETLTANEISNYLELQPDHSWAPGDLRGKSGLVERNHGWRINSQLPTTTDVELQVTATLKRLCDVADKFQKLPEDLDKQLRCIIYSTNANSGIYFSLEVVRAAAELGLSLDVDIFRLPVEG